MYNSTAIVEYKPFAANREQQLQHNIDTTARKWRENQPMAPKQHDDHENFFNPFINVGKIGLKLLPTGAKWGAKYLLGEYAGDVVDALIGKPLLYGSGKPVKNLHGSLHGELVSQITSGGVKAVVTATKDWVEGKKVKKLPSKTPRFGHIWQVAAGHSYSKPQAQAIYYESADIDDVDAEMAYRSYARGRRGYRKSYRKSYKTRGRAGGRRTYRKYGKSYRPGRRTAMRTVPRMAYPQGLQKNWYDIYFNVDERIVLDTAANSLANVPPNGAATGAASSNNTALCKTKAASLFGGIVQGTTVAQRQGNRIVCNSIFIDLNFHRPTTADEVTLTGTAGDTVNGVVVFAEKVNIEDYIHVILVRDTQCNGTAMTLNKIFEPLAMFDGTTDVGNSTANWLRNMDHVLQFQIITHQKIKWAPGIAAITTLQGNTPGTNMAWGVAGGDPTLRAQISIKCNEIINYNGVGGSVADILDNNVGMFIVTERITASDVGHIQCNAAARMRFQTLC